MTIQQHIEAQVRIVLAYDLEVVSDYATDYEDFITDYSKHLPGAMIVYDGFTAESYYERSSNWVHTYRLILNLERSQQSESDILAIRDQIYKEVLGDLYEIHVTRGQYLAIDKSKTAFEFTIEATEGV